MRQPKLSICIPTYNRKEFLAQLIESIIAQSDPEQLEIVVSDNASTDNTTQLMTSMCDHYSNIKYYRASQNFGPDQNYLNSVACASGEYCWLMGSDDVLSEKAVSAILKYLETDADIYLMGRCEASFNLESIRNRVWLDQNEFSQRFNFSNPSEILRYFQACRALGGMFSYLSSIVVKKQKWDSVDFDQSFIGTAYSHVYILLSLVMQGCQLDYLTDPLVISRSGNDSFFTDWVSRVLLDFNGYKKLADYLIKDKRLHQAFLGIMRHEYPNINLIKTKILSPSVKWRELVKSGKDVYGFPAWVFIAADILYPFGRLALTTKRAFKKNSILSLRRTFTEAPRC